MSMERTEIVTCPQCGRKKEFVVWDTLNGNIDPYAKEQLLNGTLFQFKCNQCGHTANVDYPILYHDMTHNTMVSYTRPNMIDDVIQAWERAENFMGDNAKRIGIPELNTRKRIVTEQNRLREKTIIFENNLDDRVIEVVKLLTFLEAYKENKEIDLMRMYFIVVDGKYIIEIYGEKPTRAEIPKEMYESVRESLAKKIEEVGEDYIVDITWAMRLLGDEKEN